MDAAMVTAVAALIGTPVAAMAAVVGARIQARVQRAQARAQAQAQRDESAVTGFNSLAEFLVKERDKAQQETAVAEADLAASRLEIDRLRAEVRRLGGIP